MADKVKIKTLAAMLIAGEHVAAGSTIDVDDGLARQLIGSERAVEIEDKPAAAPAAAGKSETEGKGGKGEKA